MSIYRRDLLRILSAGTFAAATQTLHSFAADMSQDEHRTSIKSVGDVPTLVVDDRPIRTAAFETYAPRQKYFEQFADADTDVFGFSTNAAACDYRHSRITWVAESTWDYSQFEEHAAMVVAARPDAMLLPRINLGTPRWWLKQNPDVHEKFDDGSTIPRGENPTLPTNRAFPSFASVRWRETIGSALERLIKHVRNSRFGPNVIGWCLAGGHTEEWYHWGCNTPLLAGYSDPTTTAFREWLRKKYGNDTILRDAWNDRDVTLTSAEVPTREERLAQSQSGFRDPTTQMNVVDFYQFWNQLIPETIEYFARVARNASDNQHVIGAFYGYLYEFGGDPEFGHNAVSHLVRSPHIDFMSVTASYFNRQVGSGSDYQRSPAASLTLHGKLWYHDNDVVSYRARKVMTERGLTDDDNWTQNLSLQLKLLGYTETPEKSRWMYRRGWGFAQTHGMHQAWFDLHDGYFDAPDLMQEVRRLNAFALDSRTWNRGSIAEILVVADELSCAYTNPRSRILKRALTEPQNQLTRIGAPCDHILLDDIPLVDARHYKLILFLNCYHVSLAQRRAILRLQCDGRHLVWFGTPGWFTANKRSLNEVHALTSLKFRLSPGDSFPIRVDDTEATSFASSKVGSGYRLVKKSCNDWTSYYASAPNLPASLIRNVAKHAGVHLFGSDDDVLYANKSLVVFHSLESGKRQLKFPEESDVTDLIRGTTWRSVRSITIETRKAETHLLHWQSS